MDLLTYFVVRFFYFIASWFKGLLKAVAMTMLGNGGLKDEERNGVISIWVLKNGSSTTDVLIQWFCLIPPVNELFNIIGIFGDFNIFDDFFWLYTGYLGLICLKWRIMSYFLSHKNFWMGLYWRFMRGFKQSRDKISFKSKEWYEANDLEFDLSPDDVD